MRRAVDYSRAAAGRATYFLGLHAALCAALSALFGTLFLAAPLPWTLGALWTLLSWVLLTGAFHMDGFADTCDGMFSGRSEERILTIMKDPLLGSFGAIGLLFDLASHGLILYELGRQGRLWAFPLMALGGKLALLGGAALGPLARPNSSAALWIGNIPRGALVVNGLFYVLAAYFLRELPGGLLGLVAVLLFTLATVRWCRRRVGGLVGDHLGFLAQVGQVLVGAGLLLCP